MSSLIVGHNLTELGLIKERINKGLKKDYITFYPEEKNLDLDIKKIEKEKGKEWTKTLKKQLKAFVEIIEKFEESK
ncbi:MAG TPA: hypothetical protein ENN30_01430 [Candidatus Woesearchaeota archaeon]|nr:hypothetical protein [Candidatus Woesearchaeota archaeon]